MNLAKYDNDEAQPVEVSSEMVQALVDQGDVDEANSSNLDQVGEAIATAPRQYLDSDKGSWVRSISFDQCVRSQCPSKILGMSLAASRPLSALISRSWGT